MQENKTVFVEILDKDYQIACPQGEDRALHRAANELDARMRTIRSSGTIVGAERIAVMAALNLCHELQSIKKDTAQQDNTEQFERLLAKLEDSIPSD